MKPDTETMQSRTRATAPTTSPFVREVYVAPTTADFKVGDRVTLDSRGMGRVIKVTEQYVLVDFGASERSCIPAGTQGFSRL